MTIKTILFAVGFFSMVVGAALCWSAMRIFSDGRFSMRMDREALQARLMAEENFFAVDIQWRGERIAAIPDLARRRFELEIFKRDFLSLKFDDKSPKRIALTASRYFNAYDRILALGVKCRESEEDSLDFDFKVLSRYPHVITNLEKLEMGPDIRRFDSTGVPLSFSFAKRFRHSTDAVLRFKKFDQFVDSLDTVEERNAWVNRLNAITNCQQFAKHYFRGKSSVSTISNKTRHKRPTAVGPLRKVD